MNTLPNATTTTLGELLKRLRKRAGMTQDDLAAATGYSRSLIAALERNRRLADAARTKVRAALDPALYAEAFAAGRQLSLEEALARMS